MSSNKSQAGGDRDRVRRLALSLRSLVVGRAEAWADVELTMPQMRALFLVRASGQVTVGGLAGATGVRLASASALVDRLARAGLVEREVDQDDRRRVRVGLSPAGEEWLSDLDERASARFDGLLEGMSPEGLEALERALEELVRLAREDNEGLGSRG